LFATNGSNHLVGLPLLSCLPILTVLNCFVHVSSSNHQCRAVAAAVFGTSAFTLTIVPVDTTERFEALSDGTVDLLAASVSHTMERDLYEVRVFFVSNNSDVKFFLCLTRSTTYTALFD